MPGTQRRVFHVRGVVQGVGFRPFVHRLASSLGVQGAVWNGASGVTVDAEGPVAALDEFARRLRSDAPPMARVDEVAAEHAPVVGAVGFRIAASTGSSDATTTLPPDLAVCGDCLRELFDPSDRRFRYPFITCTNCGPRFTITRRLPYDRPNTTMVSFPLCEPCRAEYDDPTDRRFHAQPLACPECGPRLELVGRGAVRVGLGEEALGEAQRLLAAGAIVAVKALGGYHLMCDAENAGAVDRLRQRKRRGDKPFAVLVDERHAEVALEGVASLGPAAWQVLRSPQRPIVLVRRCGASGWADAVAPGVAEVGLMLPSTPLQHLLFDGLPTRVLVCTSGNLADEPIVTDDDAALDRLATVADAWLRHDRPIHTACDDSIVRLHRDAPMLLRRARGWVPLHLELTARQKVRPVLAMGGDLKGAVCVAAGRHAWMSQHLGDLDHARTYQAAVTAVEQLLHLTGVRPELVVVDAHPAYRSARLGRETAARLGVPVVAVQHHHAHVASVLADRGIDEPVVAAAFDGTGYGPDGTMWGGEVLAVDEHGAERLAHLAPVSLPASDAAAEHPARAALAHLRAAGVAWEDWLVPVRSLTPEELDVLAAQVSSKALSVPSSSMGRLFDAVAALVGVRTSVSYEAQAAIELEAVADPDVTGAYRFGQPGPSGAVPVGPLIEAVVADLRGGATAGAVSIRFHRGVTALVAELVERAREERGVAQVALSGGVFQNSLLVELCTEALTRRGYAVWTHRQVPPNDGGLALGQALVAGRVSMGQG